MRGKQQVGGGKNNDLPMWYWTNLWRLNIERDDCVVQWLA
jgi:hypothetical protein